MTRALLERGKRYPKSIFLIDALGAMVTIVLLRFVLVRFVSVLGIPISALYLLATIPCFFIVYDLISYFVHSSKTAALLSGIAFLNLMYCPVSIGLAFYHRAEITVLGWLYVLAEISIIMIIALYEWRVSNQIRQ